MGGVRCAGCMAGLRLGTNWAPQPQRTAGERAHTRAQVRPRQRRTADRGRDSGVSRVCVFTPRAELSTSFLYDGNGCWLSLLPFYRLFDSLIGYRVPHVASQQHASQRARKSEGDWHYDCKTGIGTQRPGTQAVPARHGPKIDSLFLVPSSTLYHDPSYYRTEL